MIWGAHFMSSWMVDKVSGGRIVRVFVHRRGELVDQWFIVAIDNDEKAKIAIAKRQPCERIEIATLSQTVLARWNLRQGEIKPAPQANSPMREAIDLPEQSCTCPSRLR